jgi:hypothetical protein
VWSQKVASAARIESLDGAGILPSFSASSVSPRQQCEPEIHDSVLLERALLARHLGELDRLGQAHDHVPGARLSQNAYGTNVTVFPTWLSCLLRNDRHERASCRTA